jgi:hypothetical protein
LNASGLSPILKKTASASSEPLIKFIIYRFVFDAKRESEIPGSLFPYDNQNMKTYKMILNIQKSIIIAETLSKTEKANKINRYPV